MSILDQYVNDETLDDKEEKDLVEKKPKRKSPVKKNDNNTVEVEEKREQLSILAVLATIDKYVGFKMSLGDVKKLSIKDVEKYYNRYQVVLGNQVTKTLVNSLIEISVGVISYIIPIDNNNELCKDLQENNLLRQELDNIAGYALLRGGRLVALSSCLPQFLKHVKITKNDNDWLVPETIKDDNNMDEYINDVVDKTLEMS